MIRKSKNKRYIGDMIKVAIVDLGEHLPLDLHLLSEKLNSLQSSFSFEVVQPINAISIGEPDIEFEWHELEKLFKLLYSHHRIANYDYMVGITHFKITLERETANLPKKSYFSECDYNKVSVISVNEKMLSYISHSKNSYQYIAVCIMGHLLGSMAKKDIYHLADRYCLFDECEDRSNLRHVIDNGQICPECIAELSKANVSQVIINDVLRVLAWGSRDSLRYSIMLAAKNPITILALGIGFGWLSRAFI